jgi:5-aminolevulinate synthase
LRQSRSMCPFLHKTSPATLRSLSTTAAAHAVSPGAGSMSNLQVLGRRCPIMGKALAVQSARSGNSALAGAFGGVRAYHSRVNRAKLHTSTSKEAHPVEFQSGRAQDRTSLLPSPLRMLLRHGPVLLS